jgi:hypothetical protein
LASAGTAEEEEEEERRTSARGRRRPAVVVAATRRAKSMVFGLLVLLLCLVSLRVGVGKMKEIRRCVRTKKEMKGLFVTSGMTPEHFRINRGCVFISEPVRQDGRVKQKLR